MELRFIVGRGGGGGRGEGVRAAGAGDPAFSLVELMMVLVIAGMILLLAPVGWKGFQRGRRAAALELRATLETARVMAQAEHTDVYVAFSDGSAPCFEDRFTRFALFVPRSLRDGAVAASPDLLGRELVGASNWHRLPEGVLLAWGSEFEARPGEAPVLTLLDAARKEPGLKRPFPFLDSGMELCLPFLLFNARGQLEFPPLHFGAYHQIGVVEALLRERGDGAEERGPERRVYPGLGGVAGLPRGELLQINPHHGRVVLLHTAGTGAGRVPGQEAAAGNRDGDRGQNRARLAVPVGKAAALP